MLQLVVFALCIHVCKYIHIYTLRLHQMIESYERKLERFNDKIHCSRKNILALFRTKHMQKNSINSTVLLLSQPSIKFWGGKKQFSQAWECLDPNQIQQHSKVTGNQESGSPGTQNLGRTSRALYPSLAWPGYLSPHLKAGHCCFKEHPFRTCPGACRVNFHRLSRTGHFSRPSLNATRQAGQCQSSSKSRAQKQEHKPLLLSQPIFSKEVANRYTFLHQFH